MFTEYRSDPCEPARSADLFEGKARVSGDADFELFEVDQIVISTKAMRFGDHIARPQYWHGGESRGLQFGGCPPLVDRETPIEKAIDLYGR